MVLPKLTTTMFVWRFATAEFDEAARVLRVGGSAIDMEPRPLEVLLELLRHAGEVVTKEDLLDSVYGHRHLSDGALAQAIRRLRRALGDEGQKIITTVHRVGYKLSAAVRRQEIARPRPGPLLLKAGDSLPRREHWRLVRTLGGSEVEVWLIEHDKTHAQRVLKLCTETARLSALKREVTLSRVLRETLGERDDLVPVIDWNFDDSPFFIECEYGGVTLVEWAQAQGGLSSIPLADRLRMIEAAAVAVDAAHSADVLHKDLKPTNVLAQPASDGTWRPRLIDFGSGHLLEPERLEALRITQQGFTRQLATDDEGPSGTPLYVSPEVVAGQVPTVQSDVYALGVMLYQTAAGDFKKPMTSGWEDDIPDPLLRADIAFATHGNPLKRMRSAGELAERLHSLNHRRAASARSETRPRMRVAVLSTVIVVALAAAAWQLVPPWQHRGSASAASTNLEANDAYLHALALSHRQPLEIPDWLALIASLHHAVDLDPRFAAAWALLAQERAHLYFNHYDTEASREDATRALKKARELEPNSPGTLVAQGYVHYWIDADYEAARQVMKRVHERWPDRVEATIALARIARRQGQLPESARYFEEALSIEKVNVEVAEQAAEVRLALKQFPAALKLANHALDIAPSDVRAIGIKAEIHQQLGDLQAANSTLAPLSERHGDFDAVSLLAQQAWLRRDLAGGMQLWQRYLAAPDVPSEARTMTANLELSHLLLMRDGKTEARPALNAVRETLEAARASQPSDPRVVGSLALVCADLGDVETARALAQSAVSFDVVRHDAARLAFLRIVQARVAARTGDKDEALTLLSRLMSAPFARSFAPGLFAIDPEWDGLRSDPRFAGIAGGNVEARDDHR